MSPKLQRLLLVIAVAALLMAVGYKVYEGVVRPWRLERELADPIRLECRLLREEGTRYPADLSARVAAVLERRLETMGLAWYRVVPAGEDRVLLELAQRYEEDVEAIRGVLQTGGSLLFRILVDDSDDLGRDAEIEKFREWRARNPDAPVEAFDRVPEEDGGPRRGVAWYGISPKADAQESLQAAPDVEAVLVRVESELRGQAPGEAGSWDFSGADLQYVGPSVDGKTGFPAVQFELAEERESAFGDYTEAFKGRFMAIILNGRVNSAPMIQQRLPGGGIITGGIDGFSPDEVRELVTVLRLGNLPVPIQVVRVDASDGPGAPLEHEPSPGR